MLPDIAIKKFPCKLRYNHSWPNGMPSISSEGTNKGMQGDEKWDARRRKIGCKAMENGMQGDGKWGFLKLGSRLLPLKDSKREAGMGLTVHQFPVVVWGEERIGMVCILVYEGQQQAMG